MVTHSGSHTVCVSSKTCGGWMDTLQRRNTPPLPFTLFYFHFYSKWWLLSLGTVRQLLKNLWWWDANAKENMYQSTAF